jgi:hypothetical protein
MSGDSGSAISGPKETGLSDASMRYILPRDAALTANLGALWGVDPKLARLIEAIDDGEAYPVERSRDGAHTVALMEPGGAKLYLHSRFAPIEEARRLAGHANVEKRTAFFVQGFGLGYHVEALFERSADDAQICVLEPDLRLLRTALEWRDYSKLIASKRVVFFTTADKAPLFTRLAANAALFGSGFEIISHPPSVRIAPEFHGQMRQWVCDFASYCQTSLTTLVINGRVTFENIARNLPWYCAAPGLDRLRDCYAGEPAIVVSAGPSLRKNMHLLGEAKGRAVLVAVQTTLGPLVASGVEPEFVTSLDYHPICTRFFEGLPSGLKTELVAEPKATSAIFDLNPGPLTLLGNNDAELLLEDAAVRKPCLRSGATVAHLAYYLAEFMGCDPIIFVGQDLGFADGLCYAPGTRYEEVWRPELTRFCSMEMKHWEQIVRDRPILRRVADYRGEPTYTEERLFTYLQQFERDFASSKARIIDATEGGVLKRGAEAMTLREALDRFCAGPLTGGPGAHGGLDWGRVGAAVGPLRRRREQAVEISEISGRTLELLEEIRDHQADQGRVNQAIARLDPLRARINELGPCYFLVTQLLQSGELARFRADQLIGAERLEGNEKQSRQTTRDIEHVRGVMKAAGEFLGVIDDAIARVEQFAAGQMREAA